MKLMFSFQPQIQFFFGLIFFPYPEVRSVCPDQISKFFLSENLFSAWDSAPGRI